jgi:predicted TIM-barrel fold metal-dependent hydrolase
MVHDETQCFWNLVNGGVLDRFPDLRVYITHGGGFVPYQLGRLCRTSEVVMSAKNQKPMAEYLENFYFDPLVHNIAMRRAVVELVGVDHLLYGSNFGGYEGIGGDLTEDLDLSEGDREKIRSGNAIPLLGFDRR